MRIVAIGSDSRPSKVISAAHSTIFHGESSDAFGKRIFGFDKNRFETETPIIRHLTRSFPDRAKICLSNSQLLIEENLAKELEVFHCVRTFETRIKKVVNVSLAKGDFKALNKMLRQHNEADFDNIYSSLPDCPELHSKVNRFREVVAIKHSNVCTEFPVGREYKVYTLSSMEKDEIERVTFSKQMFAKYPVLSLRTLTIFSEDAFSIISPHLDTDYFWLQNFDVP